MAHLVDTATSGSLVSAQRQLDLGGPEADRAALRIIALWPMSHPEAADVLRRHRAH